LNEKTWLAKKTYDTQKDLSDAAHATSFQFWWTPVVFFDNFAATAICCFTMLDMKEKKG